MSRSIHETRRELHRLRRFEYADRQRRSADLRAVRQQLALKRDIKEQVADGRRRALGPLPPTDIAVIPIHVRDEGLYIHFPASPDDIRAVMGLLPPGILDGLSSVTLSLGTEEQPEPDRDGEPDNADPFTGRSGSETFPGIYCGDVLGIYTPSSTRIHVFAYVYDAATPYREVLEVYLRLRMLSTFVHEVAHHNDFMRRRGRGRWRGDSEEKNEIYAQSWEHAFLQTAVVPYLEQTYPLHVEALRAWIQHHGGVSLPLAALAPDPRSTAKGGLVSANATFFSVAGAVRTLFEEVSEGKPLAATRLQFARDLHYRGDYDQALQIIALVRSEHPNDLEALTLEADIYEHQERYDEARALAEQVVATDTSYTDAWEILVGVYEKQQAWPELIEATTRLLILNNSSYGQLWRARRRRARAHLELGDYEGARDDLAQLEGISTKRDRQRVAELQAELAVRMAAATAST